jgi:hypothetical protein
MAQCFRALSAPAFDLGGGGVSGCAKGGVGASWERAGKLRINVSVTAMTAGVSFEVKLKEAGGEIFKE